MRKEIIATGKDVNEARENARLALGAGPLDDVQYEVIYTGSRGIFGIIGVKPAQVKAYIEIPDAPSRRQERRGKGDRQERHDNNRQDKAPAQREGKPESRKQDKKPQQKPAVKSAPKKPAATPETSLTFTPLNLSDGEDVSLDFIRTLIKNIGMNATADMFACDDGTKRITITGSDASALIGHHGETLDALQYLTSLAQSQKKDKAERSRVTIDVEGYRAKREETLRALARRMSAKAIRTGRNVMLEPMSAYERRIIHSEIQGIDGVTTNSIGSDSNRKIVIYLTDKPQKKGPAKSSDAAIVDEEMAADPVAIEEEITNEIAKESAEETAEEIAEETTTETVAETAADTDEKFVEAAEEIAEESAETADEMADEEEADIDATADEDALSDEDTEEEKA